MSPTYPIPSGEAFGQPPLIPREVLRQMRGMPLADGALHNAMVKVNLAQRKNDEDMALLKSGIDRYLAQPTPFNKGMAVMVIQHFCAEHPHATPSYREWMDALAAVPDDHVYPPNCS